MPEDKALELVEYWKLGSIEDLESARSILNDSKRVGPSLFYLYLALEKALKSKFVLQYKLHAPYTHNLLVLLEKLAWETTNQQSEDFSEINQFNTIGRYPEDKKSIRDKFTLEYAKEYLTRGELLWEWICNH